MHLLPATLAVTAVAIGLADNGHAQQMQPIDRVAAESVATYEEGTFLENVAVRANGDLLVVDHTSHTVLRVTPEGETDVFASLPDGTAGVALDLDGTVVVTSGYQDDGGFLTVLAPSGAPERVIPVPGSVFLNGATLLRAGVFLVADSVAGRLYEVDIRSGETTVWLAHETLGQNPDYPTYPGANGVKIHAGAVYVTNSAQARLVRIPLDGTAAGDPETVLTGLVIDDFAIASDGTLYGATHVFNTVVRVEPDGSATTIATADDGMTGATAVAFGRTEADRNRLYVVTNGGVFQPPETGIVPAEIVRLDVGETGPEPLEALDHVAYPGQVAPVPAWLVRCDTALDADASIRPEFGPRYLRYLEAHVDRIAFAGQLFETEGSEDPSARLYFLTTETREEALRTMQASPYYLAGLYSACQADRFSGVVGHVMGGVAWPDDVSNAAPAD